MIKKLLGWAVALGGLALVYYLARHMPGHGV